MICGDESGAPLGVVAAESWARTPGEPAVDWKLLTTEPTSTSQEVERVVVPVAWHLLAIRTMAHQHPASAETVFSPLQLKILRKLTDRPPPENTTVGQALQWIVHSADISGTMVTPAGSSSAEGTKN